MSIDNQITKIVFIISFNNFSIRDFLISILTSLFKINIINIKIIDINIYYIVFYYLKFSVEKKIKLKTNQNCISIKKYHDFLYIFHKKFKYIFFVLNI